VPLIGFQLTSPILTGTSPHFTATALSYCNAIVVFIVKIIIKSQEYLSQLTILQKSKSAESVKMLFYLIKKVPQTIATSYFREYFPITLGMKAGRHFCKLRKLDVAR
jgi:hypothetical protein